MGFSTLKDIGNNMHAEPEPIQQRPGPMKIFGTLSSNGRPIHMDKLVIPAIPGTYDEVDGFETSELILNSLAYMNDLLLYAEEMHDL